MGGAKHCHMFLWQGTSDKNYKNNKHQHSVGIQIKWFYLERNKDNDTKIN